MTRCVECGATYSTPGDNCEARWHALLALDHSQRAPWGPLHGLAFATYTLQHSGSASRASVARALDALERIVARGEPARFVFAEFRRAPGEHEATLPRAPRTFRCTIADLADFPAATYTDDLMRWARATWDAWSRER